jgi:hypothetical protein
LGRHGVGNPAPAERMEDDRAGQEEPVGDHLAATGGASDGSSPANAAPRNCPGERVAAREALCAEPRIAAVWGTGSI